MFFSFWEFILIVYFTFLKQCNIDSFYRLFLSFNSFNSLNLSQWRKCIVEYTSKFLFEIHGFMKICRYFIDNIIFIIITTELTHNITILENTAEIKPQPVALDLKNLSQYSSRSK